MSATDELLAIGDGAIAGLRTGDAEVIVAEERSELTRFAGNEIHQSVAEHYRLVRVRLIEEGRTGVGEVRGHRAEAVALAFDAAHQVRRIATASDVSPLPPPQRGADGPVAFSEATAAATPEHRAELVSVITARARERGVDAYGALSTTTTTTAIVSSTGLRRAAAATQASLVTVARGDDGGGYASRHAADIGALDVTGLAGEVVDTCIRNQRATPIEPGEYEVILSPYAVTDMLEHLGWMGFSALATQEHRSFVRIGERVMNELVTIDDDASSLEIFPFPFDDEGVTSRPVTLIDSGICTGVVYDTPTALRDGVESTGHSLPQPNTWGPLPRHLSMQAGDATWQDMVASVSRGLYITRFWYVRNVHPLRTMITGMNSRGNVSHREWQDHPSGEGPPVHAEHRRRSRNRGAGEPRASSRAGRRCIRGTVSLAAHRTFQLHLIATYRKFLAMTRSPLIGITLRTLFEKGLPDVLGRNNAYFGALDSAGATPVGISATLSELRLRELFELCDGVCLPGGPDVEPTLYGEETRADCAVEVDTNLDRAEMLLARWSLEADKPILAICRGAQVLNVALGGTLWQDLARQGATANSHYQTGSRQELTHNIDVVPELAAPRHRGIEPRRREQHAPPGGA